MPNKPNLCKDCKQWSQCERGFSRWADQEHCAYAIKSIYRDQCRYTGEVGDCKNDEARVAAAKTAAEDAQNQTW